MSSTTTTVIRVAATAAALIALAACEPIVVDRDGVISSKATMAASPTSVTVGNMASSAIEIRMRDCHTVVFRLDDGDETDVHLAPYAVITDANGAVVFDNRPGYDGTVPAGSKVVDGGDGGVHRIVVPVAGRKKPLTIESLCLFWSVGSHAFYPRWVFPACTTWDRTCEATAPGEGEFLT